MPAASSLLVPAQGLLVLIGQGVEQVVLPAAEGRPALPQVVIKQGNSVSLPFSLCGGEAGCIQAPFGPGLMGPRFVPRQIGLLVAPAGPLFALGGSGVG